MSHGHCTHELTVSILPARDPHKNKTARSFNIPADLTDRLSEYLVKRRGYGDGREICLEVSGRMREGNIRDRWS